MTAKSGEDLTDGLFWNLSSKFKNRKCLFGNHPELERLDNPDEVMCETCGKANHKGLDCETLLTERRRCLRCGESFWAKKWSGRKLCDEHQKIAGQVRKLGGGLP